MTRTIRAVTMVLLTLGLGLPTASAAMASPGPTEAPQSVTASTLATRGPPCGFYRKTLSNGNRVAMYNHCGSVPVLVHVDYPRGGPQGVPTLCVPRGTSYHSIATNVYYIGRTCNRPIRNTPG